jgi:hypothetical protein
MSMLDKYDIVYVVLEILKNCPIKLSRDEVFVSITSQTIHKKAQGLILN